MTKWLTTGLSLACAAALGYAYLFYQPAGNAEVIRLAKVADCQVNQTVCSVAVDEQHTIAVTIKPFNAKPMEKLALEVHGQDINSASITIDGINMAMPGFPVKLSAAKNNLFTGETSLGLCGQSDMQWQASVTVNIAGTAYLIPFIFTTTS